MNVAENTLLCSGTISNKCQKQFDIFIWKKPYKMKPKHFKLMDQANIDKVDANIKNGRINFMVPLRPNLSGIKKKIIPIP